MNKQAVVQSVIDQLTHSLAQAGRAAEEARQTATSKENVAENKYDTLGLEAAYLAHGQSNRVHELHKELAGFNALLAPGAPLSSAPHSSIKTGSLVTLEVTQDTNAENITTQYYLMGPGAGGLKVIQDDLVIFVVTPSSPIGASLLGRQAGDEFELNTGATSGAGAKTGAKKGAGTKRLMIIRVE